MATMLYQGHGSFRITTKSGTVIYVDPSLGEGYDVAADIIIVTHEHVDHNAVDKMPHNENCTILRAKDFQPKPGYYPTIFVATKGKGKMNGVRMTGVQACNSYHPIGECVGVIMEFDGITFYAAGDTSTTDDMKKGKIAEQNIDYATFPGDSYYNMDIEEASECARLVQAAHSIPIHLVPVHDINAAVLFDEEKANAFDVGGRIIMKPGDEIKLQPTKPA